MSELKDRQIIVQLEKTFHEIVQTHAGHSRQSVSSYVRGLIVEDLMRQGLVDEHVMAKVLTS